MDFSFKNIEFEKHSTGLSLGSKVDGLPGARHTEMLGHLIGVKASAIGCSGPSEIENLKKKVKLYFSAFCWSFGLY